MKFTFFDKVSVNGDVTIDVYGNAALNHHVYGGGMYGNITANKGIVVTVYGKVAGEALVLLDGADVAGEATIGDGATGTLTLKSGNAGSVPEKAEIDLSEDRTLTLGGDVSASCITGGGTLTLGSAGSLTADELIGILTLKISGTPEEGHTYLTVNDISTEGVVEYMILDDEILEKNINETAISYTISYPQRFEKTKVRIYYYKVYYGNGSSDYHIKHFYVSGKVESLTFDQPFEPYSEDSYMEPCTAETTEEVINNFFSVDEFENYVTLDTPTFTKHK